MVTEAAGEGINLQFCWTMINYDIPWNPVRLEQRIGRIHRYGNVPEAALVADVVPPPVDARRNLVRRIQDRLAGPGQMHEVLSYSFQSDDLLATLGWTAEPHVEVVNPVAAGMSRVRRAVLRSTNATLLCSNGGL